MPGWRTLVGAPIQLGDGMKDSLTQNTTDEAVLVQKKLIKNPLIRAIRQVLGRVENFKERVRLFYFKAILSPYRCPECSGQLQMIGQSECACSCGNLAPQLPFSRVSVVAPGLSGRPFIMPARSATKLYHHVSFLMKIYTMPHIKAKWWVNQEKNTKGESRK